MSTLSVRHFPTENTLTMLSKLPAMANSLLLPLSLVLVFLFQGCIAQLELPQRQFWQNLQEQQQHRLRAKTQCRIERLNAREPNRKYNYDAGYYEIWDSNSEEFECAGIEFVRYVIQPKGLYLPHYINAPGLIYVTEGRFLYMWDYDLMCLRSSF